NTLGPGHRLRALAGVDLDPRAQRLDPAGVKRPDRGVGHAEAAARKRPPVRLEQAAADIGRVGAEELVAHISLGPGGSSARAAMAGSDAAEPRGDSLRTTASASAS